MNHDPTFQQRLLGLGVIQGERTQLESNTPQKGIEERIQYCIEASIRRNLAAIRREAVES